MKKYKPISVSLWVILWLLLIAVLLVMSVGCASTCEPIIIKEPVEVEVPVPIPPEPILVPSVPGIEECAGEPVEKIRCIGRNIEKLRVYAKALVDEIEAHNAAIPQ